MMTRLRRLLVSSRNVLHHRGVAVSAGSSLNPHAQIDREVAIGRDCIVLQARLSGQCILEDRVLIGDRVAVYASKIGADCRLENGSQLANSRLESGVAIHANADLSNVQVGRFSYIARETTLADVEVGRFCSIGPRCLIGAGDHPVDFVSTSPVFYSERRQAGRTLVGAGACGGTFSERRRITIGHDVWIGAKVFVRDGVHIANGAIVAAGAVVTRDVKAYEIVGGVPARLIRSRFSSDIVEQMQAIAWWHWSEDILAEGRTFLSSGDVPAFLKFSRSLRSSR